MMGLRLQNQVQIKLLKVKIDTNSGYMKKTKLKIKVFTFCHKANRGLIWDNRQFYKQLSPVRCIKPSKLSLTHTILKLEFKYLRIQAFKPLIASSKFLFQIFKIHKCIMFNKPYPNIRKICNNNGLYFIGIACHKVHYDHIFLFPSQLVELQIYSSDCIMLPYSEQFLLMVVKLYIST